MKGSFVLSALIAVQMTFLMTQLLHAADVDGINDRDSAVQALVEYEEQLANRNAELEAIAILLQAEQAAKANQAAKVEQTKVSVKSNSAIQNLKSVKNLPGKKITIQNDTVSKIISDTKKPTASDTSSAF